MTFTESRLLPSLRSISRFSAKDVGEITFLYLVGLHTLRSNTVSVDFSKHYARQTQHNWYSFSPSSTDLHQLLSVVLDHRMDLKSRVKSVKKIQDPFQGISLEDYYVNQFLQNIKRSHYDTQLARRLLLLFERQLDITISNYRSVRRISSDWNETHVTREAKSLAITRLIQALTTRAPSGDILPELKKLAESHNLLLKNVCNPETGENCGTVAPKMGLLKQLAIATGIGLTGFLVGKALAKSVNE
jgi:hypothetical protein